MLIEITPAIEETIIRLYTETYSVTDVLLDPLIKGIGRLRIVEVLKDANIYEGIRGKNQQAKKQEKIKNTMLSRYGVENNGQRPGQGFGERNKIPYTNVEFLDEGYKLYRKAVEHQTNKTIHSMVKPDTCFYTGIRFADVDAEHVNPNDQRKRTIDHKIPVIIGYLQGRTVEEISSPENITFVLRYVNTIKGNTLHENFLPIAEYIKLAFIKRDTK
jgi:hypothetical protein